MCVPMCNGGLYTRVLLRLRDALLLSLYKGRSPRRRPAGKESSSMTPAESRKKKKTPKTPAAMNWRHGAQVLGADHHTRVIFPELCSATSAVRLTVWCKSLLFNGHGYTVYDADGQVVFRVDNYAHNWRQETVLMDKAGKVLITIRRSRKILNITESWEALKGDKDVAGMMVGGGGGGRNKQEVLFKATKDLGIPSCTVSMASQDGGVRPPSVGYRMSWSRNGHHAGFQIHRMATHKSLVAEVNRKSGATPKMLLDKDVLTLTVQPGMDQAIAMAMIMITNSMSR